MIRLDKSGYESIISDLVNTKDIKSLVSAYSKDRVYFYSILSDISDQNSPNKEFIRSSAKKFKLSESYIREQANSLVSYLYPKTTDKDYYKLLGVSPDSDKEEIRKSWTRLMRDNHPDLVGEKGLEFSREINEAYSVLKDDKKKEEYDSKILPLLKVKVLGSHKRSSLNFKKVALVLLPALLFFVFYLFSSNNEDRTELASLQSIESQNQINKTDKKLADDENSKILRQIESIEPRKKNIVKPQKVSSVSMKDKKLSEDKLISDNEIETKVNEKISYEFEIKGQKKQTALEDTNSIKQMNRVATSADIKTTIKKRSSTLKNISNGADKQKITNSNVNDAKKQKVASLQKTENIETKKSVETPKSAENKPDSSSLFKFVSDYVTAYKTKDIKKIENLFLSDALENGMPISQAIEGYSKNFSANNIIKYDLKVNNTWINDSNGYIDSNFNIVFKKLNSNQIKSSTGKITWNLIWNESRWKIKDINYNISDTKNVDKPL